MARKKKTETSAAAESSLGWFVVETDGSFRVVDPKEFVSVLDLIDGPEARGTLFGDNLVVWHNPIEGDFNHVASAIFGGVTLVDNHYVVPLQIIRGNIRELRTYVGRVVVTATRAAMSSESNE